MFALFCLIVGLFIYNAPSLIALGRFHNNGKRIVVMNIALGWTIIGWAIALEWALQSPRADYK